jgi:hypothetical protein
LVDLVECKECFERPWRLVLRGTSLLDAAFSQRRKLRWPINNIRNIKKAAGKFHIYFPLLIFRLAEQIGYSPKEKKEEMREVKEEITPELLMKELEMDEGKGKGGNGNGRK